MSMAETDQSAYLQARDSSPKELLAYAARKTGQSAFKIQKEFMAMARPPSRLNMVEYIRNGLYDMARHSGEERSRFISNDLHWPITHTCNNQAWAGTAEDKLVAATLLQAGGVAVPQSVAILGKTPRLFPGLEVINTEDALRAMLGKYVGEGLFCKIIDGMVSFGAFRIDAWTETEIACVGHPPMSYGSFLSEFVGNNAYVVQRRLNNHADFAPYTSALATVRMVNMVRADDVFCPMAVIKLPQGDNIADAFWRPGNLACDIDPETGRIQTVALRGVETEFLEDHPTVAGLMGLQLPFWSELRALNERAARIFAPIRYQSTDIAITPDGPVVVELNYGGGFDLPQYASGRGMLTPEVCAFFQSCGVDLNASPGKTQKKKRFGLF
ncbi:hypothetical protein KMP13_19165 [Epibacterium ulvae]|uniref:sugar-transfer associated ATP-grasp domain-containing protein n=1 Tax=Epibacterium ulvae TaxID=1156985 RepID=UPI001BFC6EAE|nr:sugar-transfer associated ATP-grasp domain-containing protein [Epibacterium ulvae]MBT8155943.1 hypothetical protein [Epibacterium ulvae]